jgi:hypothetical protein
MFVLRESPDASANGQEWGMAVLLALAVSTVTAFATVRTYQADVLVRVIEMVQTERMRSSRGTLFELHSQQVPYAQWNPEHVEAAEHVCQVYGTVGMLARARFFPTGAFIRQTGSTIAKSFAMTAPFRDDRAQRYHERLSWPNFVWLNRRTTRSRSFDRSGFEEWPLDVALLAPTQPGDDQSPAPAQEPPPEPRPSRR